VLELLGRKTRECDELAGAVEHAREAGMDLSDPRLHRAEEALAERYAEVKEIAGLAYKLGLALRDDDEDEEEEEEGEEEEEERLAWEEEEHTSRLMVSLSPAQRAALGNVRGLESELQACVAELEQVEASSSPAVVRHPAFLKIRADVHGHLQALQVRSGGWRQHRPATHGLHAREGSLSCRLRTAAPVGWRLGVLPSTPAPPASLTHDPPAFQPSVFFHPLLLYAFQHSSPALTPCAPPRPLFRSSFPLTCPSPPIPSPPSLQVQLEEARELFAYEMAQGRHPAAGRQLTSLEDEDEEEEEGEEEEERPDLRLVMQLTVQRLWERPYDCRLFTLQLLKNLSELDDQSLSMMCSCFSRYIAEHAVQVK
jgi:hypothetical protein